MSFQRLEGQNRILYLLEFAKRLAHDSTSNAEKRDVQNLENHQTQFWVSQLAMFEVYFEKYVPIRFSGK